MPSAKILGTIYQTVYLPDGKEWMAANLATIAYGGQWWNGAGSDDGDGAYYLRTEALAIEALLSHGWRLPTIAECRSLATLLGGTSVAGGKLKATGFAYWDAPNTGASDDYGFAFRGAGYLHTSGPGWAGKKAEAYFWTGDTEPDGGNTTCYGFATYNGAAFNVGAALSPSVYSFSIRLVRDYAPICYESSEVEYALSLDWSETADGTPVAYDDGAAYDYLTATITARVKPSELEEMEASWQSSDRLWFLDSTGRLLGPTFDVPALGVDVRMLDFRVDQPADSAMTLFDATMVVHYGPLPAPSPGSFAAVIARGVPYHTPNPNSAAWITEGGTSDVSSFSRVSTRRTMWYCQGLTHAEASDAVNYLRTLRGSSMVWTAPGTGRPFGPGEAQSSIVWIPAWKLSRESNFSWMIELELVRNG